MPRKTDSGNPADWVLVAEVDLAMVRHSLDDDSTFTGCQAKLAEALEKLMKAALLGAGWQLVKTHNLLLLADELSLRDPALDAEVRPLCEVLSEFYLGTRYPGFDFEDPDWPAFRARFDAITALAVKIRARILPPAP